MNRKKRRKTVRLPKDCIVEVIAPAGVVPVVQVDAAKKVVEIVPVPVSKKKSWWENLFSDG